MTGVFLALLCALWIGLLLLELINQLLIDFDEQLGMPWPYEVCRDHHVEDLVRIWRG